MPQRLRRNLGVLGILLWAFAVGAGLQYIWAYAVAPGEAASGPQTWPGSTLISPRPGQATLVMFVHPHCPCSRASLEELRVAVEKSKGAVSAWVLFLRPQDTDKGWENTPSWKLARQIPGVTVATDRDGVEAARFGASTSGHVVLYDAAGRFLFGGGITASRGHVGDNDGLQRVLQLLDGNSTARADHPVFGCKFHDPNLKKAD